MVELGFTGTKQGMTPKQFNEVVKLLVQFKPDRVHHGDCVGSDEDFHTIATNNGYYRHIHPPIKERYRAFCEGDYAEEPGEYLVRDQEMVDQVQLLIATPNGFKERVRSGTWATVRRARKKGIPIYIVHPNGWVVSE
jgi:hypothetical protein